MVDRGRFNDMSDLQYLDSRIRSQAPLGKKTPMPEGFQPDSWSVLCGRGKECFNHAGNKRFRQLCELQAAKYGATKSKIEKSLIVMSIVDAVREGSGGLSGGGFVKMDLKTKQWYEVGDSIAREKVGQQLRDCLRTPGRQSSICKKAMTSSTATTDKLTISSEERTTITVPETTFQTTVSTPLESPNLVAVVSNQTEASAPAFSSTASIVTKSTAFSDVLENRSLATYDENASLQHYGENDWSLNKTTDGQHKNDADDDDDDDEESFLVPPSLIAMTSSELQNALAAPIDMDTEAFPNWFEEDNDLPPPPTGQQQHDVEEGSCTTRVGATNYEHAKKNCGSNQDDTYEDNNDEEPFLVPPSLIAVPSDLVREIEFSVL